ncbi:MAG TPA: transposase [Chloroflexota bacterium]|nr:transposase [Chloroflexota bacterium]
MQAVIGIDPHKHVLSAIALEREIIQLLKELGTSLPSLFGLGPLGSAELLVEDGDPRRFRSADAFASYTGTAPIPASSGEAGGRPVHHRLSRYGNRRLNSVLHIMAVTRLRADPETQAFIARTTTRGKTSRDALRIVKRRLARLVWSALGSKEPALRNIQDVGGALAGPDLLRNRLDGDVLPQTCRSGRRTVDLVGWLEAT